MAGQYDDYRPIPAEDLPAKYAGCFKLLELVFAPPNDFDRVMTITGQSLQLITDGDDNGKRGKTLVMHAGYQKAIWELREGHLRYCPSQQRLWRRDRTSKTIRENAACSIAGTRSKASRTNTTSASAATTGTATMR